MLELFRRRISGKYGRERLCELRSGDLRCGGRCAGLLRVRRRNRPAFNGRHGVPDLCAWNVPICHECYELQ